MPAPLANALLLGVRAKLRSGRGQRLAPYPEIFLPYARGRSFADVGSMWNVEGRFALEAEAGGATCVTAVDVMEEADSFRAERERRGPHVRFVHADANAEDLVERVGVHDVVWSSGVLYHQPSPLRTVEGLAALAGETLLVQTATIPEVPGLPQACVLYPGLDRSSREAFGRVFPGAIGLDTAFEPGQGYANWWWGITPSALRAMVEVQPGLEVIDVLRGPTETVVVAKRTPHER